MKLPGSSILFVVVMMLPSLSAAHHSISPFDQEKFEEIQGKLSRVVWRNPHLRADVEVTAADGTVQTWEIEGDAINTLMRRGLTRDDLAVGTTIRFGGWPSTRGRLELMPTNLLLPDGREILMLDLDLPLRWTNPGTATVAADLTGQSDEFFRVWSYNQLYSRKNTFELTAQAEQAVAQYDPFTDTPSLRCIPPGMPNAILNPYPIEMIKQSDEILLKIEEWGADRRIDMASAAIPDDAPRNRLGYSIGRIDGNVLEIETGRLIDQLLDDDGIPMSADARIRETFTINPDTDILEYEVTVTDPTYLGEPATWLASWKSVPGAIIRPFECEQE